MLIPSPMLQTYKLVLDYWYTISDYPIQYKRIEITVIYGKFHGLWTKE